MKREYESPEIDIVSFGASNFCAYTYSDNEGAGWEEEEEEEW